MRKCHTIQADKLRHKRNRPPADEPWVWLTREFLESDAWRTAPINTRRVVERLILEHMAHAGTMNGKLVCTWRDFEKFGIGHRLVKAAISDACDRGLILVTEHGKGSAGLDRWPSKYALGWLPLHDGSAALNRWKSWKLQKPRRNDFSPRSPKDPGERRKSDLCQGTKGPPERGHQSDLGTTDFRQPVEGTKVTYSQYIGCRDGSEPSADPWADLEIPEALRRKPQ